MSNADNVSFALIAHKIGPFQFDVGLGSVNASIRDQIVRAQMIVRALGQLKRSDSERPLLICGAGIAGLAAAHEAERIGLGFVLIEQKCFPSGALAGSGNRYLSPTMYEWPAPIFDQHRHPPKDGTFLGADDTTGFVLNFTSPVNIEQLRTDLDATFKKKLIAWKTNAKKLNGKRWYFPNTRIDKASKDDLQALVTPSSLPTVPLSNLPPITLVDAKSHLTKLEIEVDWIIFAGGFSDEETCYAGINFETPPFWSADDLANHCFGISGVNRVSALIVGSGDGAIQDALRCLVCSTVPHPVAIWKKIVDGIQPNNHCNSRNIETILQEILSLDQYSNTAFMWSGKKEVFQSIDKAYISLADELLTLYSSVSYNILSILRCDISLVHVQRNHEYFTRCYALNRFLIHLIKIVLDKKNKSCVGASHQLPEIVFGHGDIEASEITKYNLPKSHHWKGHLFHRVVVRIGAHDKKYQTIGLTGIDATRVNFGRIPPPFVPAKA